MDKPVKDILIVGGGTAGWMSAALLGKVMQGKCRIRLIESDEIATIGVGEATIPPIKNYNLALQLDEDEFMRRTQGTFKLGIEFVDWKQRGQRYTHGFGKIGQDLGVSRCYQYWLKMFLAGKAPDLGHFSINTAAPLKAKFMRSVTSMPQSPLADITYAFHFDAHLYARFLRERAESMGVVRTEGRIVQTSLDAQTGFIRGVELASGERIEADLFLDCSGIRALLIEGALKTGYEDWSHWLPCDRAVAVPCESVSPLVPITRSTARESGWQWRIPLQHRIGNGHVYSSAHISDDEAADVLLRNLDGKPLADPRFIRYVPGKRRKLWNRNCVAIGLSSGFLEPLESTSIHLIQSTIIRLLKFFPSCAFREADIDTFNRQADFDYERIRDFIILHYWATEREESPMWNYCRHMSVPETLKAKVDLFRAHGRVFREWDELFTEESWIQVMIGQGIIPQSYDPLIDVRSEAEIESFLGDISKVIGKCVDFMPSHEKFIADHCSAARA